MGFRSQILLAVLAGISVAPAQVASHAPALKSPVMKAAGESSEIAAMAKKPVAKVNGTVLTEIDLRREMFAIFPYARQHNGFPKELEPDIRKGALDMIVFEELVYQEAVRRGLTVPQERVTRAQSDFRKQFPDNATYQAYLGAEMKGDKAVLANKIKRSLLIEQMLKTEVKNKSSVTPLEVKAYYDKNPKLFEHTEAFHIQTISFLPPQSGGKAATDEARKRAQEAVVKAKATKNYKEFGLLAEQYSDDDWHVNMGDRKMTERAKLPPEVVKVLLGMKAGDVSDVIQLGNAFTILRLVEHVPAGRTPFAEVKTKLQSDLNKEKTQKLRASLATKLRKGAKIEIL